MSLQFPQSYFEDEIREGFYIPSMTKRAWAAQLNVVNEIDRLCEKHGISYFLDWGSLIGAIRHGGFIPWDDDLDIVMMRADYEEFLKVAKELPPSFRVINYETQETCWELITNVTSNTKICFEEAYLDQNYGFPYLAGVDIFVLDYKSRDEEKDKYRYLMVTLLMKLSDSIADGSVSKKEKEQTLKQIEQMLGVSFDRGLSDYDLRVELYRQITRLSKKFQENEADLVTQIRPKAFSQEYGFKKELYRDTVRVPFENLMLPVPAGYDALLHRKFGEYMRINKSGGEHGYPYYETQEASLETDLEYAPTYHCTEQVREQIFQKEPNQCEENSLKDIAREYLKYLDNLLTEFSGRSQALSQDLLAEIQQNLIDFGTLIEQTKGEGTRLVSQLEALCELLYELSQSLAANLNRQEELRPLLDEIQMAMNLIQSDLLDRKEIVFICYKPEFWKSYQAAYEEALSDPTTDVFVIPVPWYYKKYDGSFLQMNYQPENYPKELSIVKYDEFDFGLHRPEKIYIQNPYDEYNMATSVHPFFYSGNLKKYTEELIYIPYFEVDDWVETSFKDFHNMKHYCPMPGVVHADHILLESELLRKRYIDYLSDWAGEDSRTVWEEKIRVTSRKECQKPETASDKRKILLYYMSVSILAVDEEKAIAKLEKNLQIFKDNCDKIKVVWVENPEIKAALSQINPELYRKYRKLRDQAKADGIDCRRLEENLSTRRTIYESLVAEADAFYGDGGSLANLCRQERKPVMIQNLDV